jgi:hypothetical protein
MLKKIIRTCLAARSGLRGGKWRAHTGALALDHRQAVTALGGAVRRATSGLTLARPAARTLGPITTAVLAVLRALARHATRPLGDGHARLRALARHATRRLGGGRALARRTARAVVLTVVVAMAATATLGAFPQTSDLALAAAAARPAGAQPGPSGQPAQPGTNQIKGLIGRLTASLRSDQQLAARLGRLDAKERHALVHALDTNADGLRIAALSAELNRLWHQMADLNHSIAAMKASLQLLKDLQTAVQLQARTARELAATAAQDARYVTRAANALQARNAVAELQRQLAMARAPRLAATGAAARLDPMTIPGARVTTLWAGPQVSTSHRTGLIRGPSRGSWPAGGREVSTDRQVVLYRVTAPDGAVYLELAYQRLTRETTDGSTQFADSLITPQEAPGLMHTQPITPAITPGDIHIGHLHLPAPAAHMINTILGDPSAYVSGGPEIIVGHHVTTTETTSLADHAALVIRLAGPGGSVRAGLLGGPGAPAWATRSTGPVLSEAGQPTATWMTEIYYLLAASATMLNQSVGVFGYLEPVNLRLERSAEETTASLGFEMGFSYLFAPSLEQAGQAAIWLLGASIDPVLHALGLPNASIANLLGQAWNAVINRFNLDPVLNNWLNIVSEPENVSISVTLADLKLTGIVSVLDAAVQTALSTQGIYMAPPSTLITAALAARPGQAPASPGVAVIQPGRSFKPGIVALANRLAAGRLAVELTGKPGGQGVLLTIDGSRYGIYQPTGNPTAATLAANVLARYRELTAGPRGVPLSGIVVDLSIAATGAPVTTGPVTTRPAAPAASSAPKAPARTSANSSADSALISYEDGTADGWSPFWGDITGVVSTQTAYAGTHCLMLTTTGDRYSAIGTTTNLQGLKPGDEVIYHVWSSGQPGGVRPFAQDGDYDIYFGQPADTPLPARAGWFTLTWTVPSLSGLRAIGMQVTNPGSGSFRLAVDAMSWPGS